MRTQLQPALLLLIVSVVVSAAQPAPVKINPSTGLPDDGSTPQKIDPATGLPQSNLYNEWQKANALMNQGQYEDSLQAFTNYFELSRFEPDQAGFRLFSIIDWVELGRRYPAAKQSLLELRDTDAQKLLNGEGNYVYFGEVQVINFDLGNAEATYTLFKAIEQHDDHLAGQCYLFIEDQLIQKGEYATCRKYLSDPESHFQSFSSLYQMQARSQAAIQESEQRIAAQFKEQGRNPPAFSQPDNSAMIKSQFVSKVRGLIEILVGTGDKADAEKIQREALVVLDDPRLETAVADANEKIIRH